MTDQLADRHTLSPADRLPSSRSATGLPNDPIQPAATDGRSMEKRVTAARLQ
jgi:hypothetical protein